MENKYYTPSIEEFYIGFEYEVRDEVNYAMWSVETFDEKFLPLFSVHPPSIKSEIEDNNIRVKYLDKEDIESLGFNKSVNSQWVGWSDYYSGHVSGEYGYFLYITLHVPILYNKSNRLEDNLFKIILHRHYVSNENETTNIRERLERNESELIYKGTIKNKSEFEKLLIQLGVGYDTRD